VNCPAPVWLEVRAPSSAGDQFLTHLDAGERDAILLAEELHADQLIIDETRGRQEAKRRGLPFTGTLGILQAGAKQGLLDLKSVVGCLRQTSFHISQDILDELLKRQQ
jgi:predicted nucleic acid-binding protein